jgi:hypothetical protein
MDIRARNNHWYVVRETSSKLGQWAQIRRCGALKMQAVMALFEPVQSILHLWAAIAAWITKLSTNRGLHFDFIAHILGDMHI